MSTEQIIPDLSPGVTLEYLNDPISKRLASFSNGGKGGLVRFQPYNQVYPEVFIEFERKVKRMEVREDGVWFSTFPKCGKLSHFLS